MSHSGRTPDKLLADAQYTPVNSPSTSKTKSKDKQLSLPIPYSPDQAKLQQLADLSPNKLGTATSPATVSLSSANDTQRTPKTPSPVKPFLTASGLFKPAQETTSLEHETMLVSSEQAVKLARTLAYDKFFNIIKTTDTFKDYATYSALDTLIKMLNKEIKNNLKAIDAPNTFKQHLLKANSAHIAAITAEKTAISTPLNKKLKQVSPGFENIDSRNYGNPAAARTLAPKVLELMINTQEILEGIEKFHADREAFNRAKTSAANKEYKPSVDPALLISDITILNDEKSEKHVCLMSFSGAEGNTNIVNLVNVMKKHLENKELILDNEDKEKIKKYEIVIASHLSDNFQYFVNDILKALDEQAKLAFFQRVKKMYDSYSDEQKTYVLNAVLDYLNKDIDTECITPSDEKIEPEKEKSLEEKLWQAVEKKSYVKQHNKDALKTCAEKPFIAELAKAQMLLALDNSESQKKSLILNGMDCLEFTFRREGHALIRGTLPHRIEASAASVSVPVSKYNQYLKHPADESDESKNPNETYNLNFIVPCSACAINKGASVVTLFAGFADYMQAHKHQASIMQVTDILKTFTPRTKLSATKQKNASLSALRKFLEETPLKSKLNELIKDTLENYFSQSKKSSFEAALDEVAIEKTDSDEATPIQSSADNEIINAIRSVNGV